MPIYEYLCAGCGAQFESIRPVSRADDPINCKTCGEPGKRQISNFSFKSDTFTAPKLRNRPAPTFRGHNAGQDEDANETQPSSPDSAVPSG